jgi:hypothetical protein
MTFTPLQYSAALWEATGLSNQQLLARSSAGVVIHKRNLAKEDPAGIYSWSHGKTLGRICHKLLRKVFLTIIVDPDNVSR